MFKKLRTITAVMLIAVMSLSAAVPETGSVNYFTDLIGDPEYTALLRTVFNDQGLDKALEDYKTLVAEIS
ncbi:MAG: hypothetical protein ACI4NM_04425, partial [Bullifex sp.]